MREAVASAQSFDINVGLHSYEGRESFQNAKFSFADSDPLVLICGSMEFVSQLKVRAKEEGWSYKVISFYM